MTTPPKKKPHVATGRPKGGARPGAGRPPGIPGLPNSAVPAIQSLKMRVPKDASDEQKELLLKSEQAIVKVMEGKVHGSIASAVLLAARTAREEICGPIAKTVNVEAKVGIAALLDDVKIMENELPPAQEQPKLPPAPKGPIIRKKAANAVVALAVAALDEPDDRPEPTTATEEVERALEEE